MKRRKFVKLTTVAAAAAGATGLLLNSQLVMAQTSVYQGEKVTSDTKDLFKKCGACSHLYFYLLNREFGHMNETAETASDPLAGGLMLGHQCGMLWGSSLAIGAEAYRSYKEQSEAIAVAVQATENIMKSFVKRAESVNCHEITGCDVSKKSGIAKMMLKIIFHGGMKNSPCFKLAEKWAPEAIQTARDSLKNCSGLCHGTCASEVVKRMGGSDEETVTVSGLAGGMGLQGHACGALGAAVWMSTLRWCRENPGQSAFEFGRINTSRITKAFFEASGNQILCSDITGRKFNGLSDHQAFLNNGGCERIIDTLSKQAK